MVSVQASRATTPLRRPRSSRHRCRLVPRIDQPASSSSTTVAPRVAGKNSDAGPITLSTVTSGKTRRTEKNGLPYLREGRSFLHYPQIPGGVSALCRIPRHLIEQASLILLLLEEGKARQARLQLSCQDSAFSVRRQSGVGANTAPERCQPRA
jgi:hypothetical protein